MSLLSPSIPRNPIWNSHCPGITSALTPKINSLSIVKFFSHNNNNIILPEPLVIEGNQRPLPC